MKKEVRRCKYLIPLESGNEVSYALKAIYHAKDLAIDLRAELSQLANQFDSKIKRVVMEREVAHLTDLLISLTLFNEQIITNIVTEEVDE